MSTQLIVFGIQAALRAAQAGADLYREHARDRKVFLPDLELPEGTRSVQLLRFLIENPGLAGSDPTLEAIWDPQHRELTSLDPDRIDAAYAVMLEHKAKQTLLEEGRSEDAAGREAKMLAAGRMVEQWREERKPPSPIVRMALTLTDIGLEYVSSEPSILGEGSRGEKLIVAFAENMSALIPNEVDAFGPRTDFSDRVLGIFLRAGLGTLSSNASLVFRDEDVARLVEGVTKPVVDALPTSLAKQIRYRDLVDALASPAAEAAFKLLADNTETYLGKGFANDKALGAVTTALFQEIQSVSAGGSVVDAFSEQGLIRLYQAGLGVAVDRPELFVDSNGSAKSDLFKELLSGTASILREHPRFTGPVGASLAAMAVSAVGSNAPALLKLDPNEPWENVAVAALEQLTKGLSEGLSKGALEAFTDTQLLELGRIVLTQMAKTPGMLGTERTEVQAIVAGVAEAMAADDNLLLSSDEWLSIAAVAAEKAAANPGRLFRLSTDDAGGALAATVIKSVLQAASEAWGADGRADRPLLFGETLARAVEAAIEALAGNIAALAQAPEILDQFLADLLERAAQAPEKYGSQALLNVIRGFIGSVFATGNLPSDQDIEQALAA